MENNIDTKVENFAVGPSTHDIICPNCGGRVKTKVEYKPTVWTYVLSCLLCPILCCCLPCICGCFLQIKQKCPNCQKYLGIYKRNLIKVDD